MSVVRRFRHGLVGGRRTHRVGVGRAFAEVQRRLGVEVEDPGPEPTDEPRAKCGTCKGAGSVSAAVAESGRRSGEASAATFEADVARVAERMTTIEAARWPGKPGHRSSGPSTTDAGNKSRSWTKFHRRN